MIIISLNKLIGHCLLALIGKAGKVVIGCEAGIVATVTVLIVEEHAVQTISIELSLQLKSKLLAVLVVEVCTASAVMVAENAKENLHALLLQRCDIFLTVLEHMGDVLVVEVVNLTCHNIIVDVAREEDDLVDNILARLLQRVAEVMKRVGIVGLLTRDDDLACVLVMSRTR